MVVQGDGLEGGDRPSPQWDIDDPLVVLSHEIHAAEQRRDRQMKAVAALSGRETSFVHAAFALRGIEMTLRLLREHHALLTALSDSE